MNTNPCSNSSINLSDTALRLSDHDDSLVVPNLAQDEAFALIDAFYGPSPAQSSAPAPVSDFNDDDFANLMQGLDEIEKSTKLPDCDSLMPDGLSAHRKRPAAIASAAAATSSTFESGHIQPSKPDLSMRDASSSPHSGLSNPLLNVSTKIPLTEIATSLQSSEILHAKALGLPQSLPLNAPPAASSPKVFDGEPSASSPTLPLAPAMAAGHQFETPTLPPTNLIFGSGRASSRAPSSGGHRSSMQGEMRQEEEELASGDLGTLPPFPDLRTNTEHLTGQAEDSVSMEGHRLKSYDLSSSLDINKQHLRTLLQLSHKHDATSPPPLVDLHQSGNAKMFSVSDGRRDSVLVETSSPSGAPVTKARRLPWMNPSESLSKPAEKSTQAAKPLRLSDSDSSLTDVSLSAILAGSPGPPGEQPSVPTDNPLRTNKQERKGSVATSLHDSKSEPPLSPVKDKTSAKRKPSKPKAANKRKRNDAPASGASPASEKSSKIAKTIVKDKKLAPVKRDLKGIIEAGVLGDVLGNKGGRRTRGQQTALENSRPDPALAAKSRHTEQINYKE